MRDDVKSDYFYLEDRNLFFKNGKLLGQIVPEVDGYYYFQFEDVNGTISDGILIALGKFIQDLNKDWDKQVERELAKYKDDEGDCEPW